MSQETFSRRKLISAAATACVLPAVPAMAANVPEITFTTYGGNYENFFRKEVIPGFEAKYGCKVKLAVGLSKDWLAEIRASGKDRAPYDVVMFNDIWSAQLRKEDYFAELDPKKIPNLANARYTFNNAAGKKVAVIVNIDPVGLAYRTDLLKTPPKSWAELWDPKYKGMLGLYTLTNSIGAMTVFTASYLKYGDQKHYREGMDRVFSLKPFKLSDFSGDMEKLLTMGEVQIAPMSAPGINRLKKKGVPVEFVTPKELLMMFEQVFSVHRASKQSELAQAFVNYVLSKEIQEKFVKVFYATPGVTGIEIPADVKPYMPVGPEDMHLIKVWDWNDFNSQKPKLVRYWNQNVNR